MKYFKLISINVFILMSILVFLEISFRLYNKFTEKNSENSYVATDKKYGWVHNINFKEKTLKNKCDEAVLMKTPKHRLIIKYPKYENAETTVLFIGDSYTHAHEVSTGDAYYDIFEKLGDGKYKIYAAGVGGFGTLQEYMVLNEIYNEIKPDYVIWQMCSNDIGNNVFELDNASFFNNQRPRPYYDLKTGNIFMKNPGFWLFDISQGFWFVFPKIVSFDWKYNLGFLKWINSLIALDKTEYDKYYNYGLAVTEELIKQAVEKYPNTKFIGFSVDQAVDDYFGKFFLRNQALYWNGLYKYVDDKQNTNCLPLDGHWNHYGNVVAGGRIFELFKQIK